MEKRLDKLLAKNPEAAKSGAKIKAVLKVIRSLRERGLSKEGYRLSGPADLKRARPIRASTIVERRLKLTHGA